MQSLKTVLSDIQAAEAFGTGRQVRKVLQLVEGQIEGCQMRSYELISNFDEAIP